MALALDAPAKVNLYLAVLGRRADGYHEVDTVLHALDLCDTLHAELQDPGGGAPPVSLQVSSEASTGLPVVANADNLVCRAARAFQAAVGLDACVRFHLIKRIPAGGGLGGGSSDAAAALRLLDHLAGNPVGIPGLTSLASSLGADVPFFLQAGTQRGRGVGDDLSPLPGVPGWRFVLILPPVGTATPEVYQNLAAHLIARSTADSIGRGPEVPEFSKLALPMGFRNDLEASALQLYPELAELRRDLVELGFPHASLSGSGSTFFVALPDAEQCGDAMTRLQPLRARHGVTLLETGSGLAAPGEPRLVPFSGA